MKFLVQRSFFRHNVCVPAGSVVSITPPAKDWLPLDEEAKAELAKIGVKAHIVAAREDAPVAPTKKKRNTSKRQPY